LSGNIEFNLSKFSSYLAPLLERGLGEDKGRKGGGGHLPQMPHAGSANVKGV